MEAIQIKGEVNETNQLIIQLPNKTESGTYELLLVFMNPTNEAKATLPLTFSNYQLPVENQTFSRSEIYGDNGR